MVELKAWLGAVDSIGEWAVVDSSLAVAAAVAVVAGSKPVAVVAGSKPVAVVAVVAVADSSLAVGPQVAEEQVAGCLVGSMAFEWG